MTKPLQVAANQRLMARINKLVRHGEITRIQADKAVIAWRKLAKHLDRHDLTNNWVNVHSRSWWAVLGKKLAKSTLDLLEHENVILRTTSYSTGRFPKACKIIGPFRSRRKCDFFELQHKPTIEANHRTRKILIGKNDDAGILLADWLSEFQIDRSTLSDLDAWTIENIAAINERNHFAIRDRFAGRFHSPFTQLRREARQAIRTVDGRLTYSLDVSACQPLLLGLVSQLNQKVGHIEGKRKWWVPPVGASPSPWVSLCEKGIIYSEIQRLLKNQKTSDYLMRANWGDVIDLTQLPPKQFKRQVLQLIFDQHEKSIRHPIWRVLENQFPEITQTLTALKVNSHVNAAKALQEFEAVIMLDQVAKRHARYGIPVLTVHDEIISPEPELTKRIICEVFSRYHVNPHIKVNCIEPQYSKC